MPNRRPSRACQLTAAGCLRMSEPLTLKTSQRIRNVRANFARLTLQQRLSGNTEERYHQPIDRSWLTPASRLQRSGAQRKRKGIPRTPFSSLRDAAHGTHAGRKTNGVSRNQIIILEAPERITNSGRLNGECVRAAFSRRCSSMQRALPIGAVWETDIASLSLLLRALSRQYAGNND
ncbi:hypothetical protein TNCV_3596951 [Trichonephila clavipes]|nr:hypothetical protein TNCV_3596951 [Trichonephila clavipes]